ncbi:armadillo-type protein [Lenzites betulinus]|nr:armadillo-type protein [Lenzites betulinus]
MENSGSTPSTFQRLKVICVPLLGNALLTPTTQSSALNLLVQLRDTLRLTQTSGEALSPQTISYIFFPLSTILRRNELSYIPDRILENLLDVLSLLCDSWWWTMDASVWEQVFMLCSAILGGIDRKGKGKDRDDETKVASINCLWSLLRPRTAEEDPTNLLDGGEHARAVFAAFKSRAQSAKFMPMLGQTLDSLLGNAGSPHIPLQRISMKVLSTVVAEYLPDGFVPSVLPGIVSTMSKVSLGTGTSKGWANGDIVAAALHVMLCAIVRAVGDDVCLREGAVNSINELEDLLVDRNPSIVEDQPLPPYATRRTPSWLRATASQLHIALNSLSVLVKHPTPVALRGLATFSAEVLSTTTLTMAQSQPLLLSFLLSIRTSPFEGVSAHADSLLRRMLSSHSPGRQAIMRALFQIAQDNLAALPRLLLSHADAKVEHASEILESVCSLANSRPGSSYPGVPAISAGVGKLLGPNSNVEKWGWSLLSTLEFENPTTVATPASVIQLMLENDLAVPYQASLPELTLRHVSSREAYQALERMFRALGATAGEDCLFSVEWFVDVGHSGTGRRAVAALWVACRLLEGLGKVSLDPHASMSGPITRTKRLEKFARNLARRIGETWDDIDREELSGDSEPQPDADENNVVVEHVQGLSVIRGFSTTEPMQSSVPLQSTIQPMLHRGISLQLLSITAGILEARFLPLLLHTLYPVLHGVVSDSLFVSTSALAALNSIATSTSFATPANLLLSNFDYALDAVSRRLTRRWLDVDATKVLAVLVRLVGRDVVQKAGDVVEECFDRLDEYHGYEVIVDGLLEVLREVVKVIEEDDVNPLSGARSASPLLSTAGNVAEGLDAFAEWYAHRSEPKEDKEPLRDGSYPREAWGKAEEDADADTSDVAQPGDNSAAEIPPTPSQALTQQIVARSLFFLTHGSPPIRARILLLLAHAVPVLPESALLPSVHQAWPFVLNRLGDAETFVVGAAATLIAALATHVGDFMHRRIWDDVWPRFRRLLRDLERADASNALAHRGGGTVGTGSAYTHSHRLYKAIIQTLTAAARRVQAQDAANWEVIVLFRRFLDRRTHEELQACARELYEALCRNNEDAVWLGLSGTLGWVEGCVAFLQEPKWDLEENVRAILRL